MNSKNNQNNQSKLKVVFFGTPQIGATILEGLIANPAIEVVGVVTQPDKPTGRKKLLTPSPVKKVAEAHHLPIYQPDKVKTIIDDLDQLKADFFITCAYGQFLPTKLLDLPRCEALNLHGSLLPKYRGGTPIQTAILNGETETGMSLMRMVKAMDAGPYFAQKIVPIPKDIDAGKLFELMAIAGVDLLNDHLVPIANGELKSIEQDESLVTFAPVFPIEKERLDWNQSVEALHNQVRALSPNPGAWTTYDKERFKILKTTTKPINEMTIKNELPGTIVDLNKHEIVVQTQKGLLAIKTIQKAGKKPTEAGIFGLNAFQIGGRFQ